MHPAYVSFLLMLVSGYASAFRVFQHQISEVWPALALGCSSSQLMEMLLLRPPVEDRIIPKHVHLSAV